MRWTCPLIAVAQSAGALVGAIARPALAAAQQSRPRGVNPPHFPGAPAWSRSAIFWFGQNQQGLPSRNYADVRVGYTNAALHVRVTVVDHALWYPLSPSTATDLTQYDAVAIYLDIGHNRSGAPQADDYWFLSAYRWDSGGNNPAWQRPARGSGIDNGWTAFFNIPFASLVAACWKAVSGVGKVLKVLKVGKVGKVDRVARRRMSGVRFVSCAFSPGAGL